MVLVSPRTSTLKKADGSESKSPKVRSKHMRAKTLFELPTYNSSMKPPLSSTARDSTKSKPEYEEKKTTERSV